MGGGRPDAPLPAAERQELAMLRRELRQLKMERDILAKDTTWFANKDSASTRPLSADPDKPGRTSRTRHVSSP